MAETKIEWSDEDRPEHVKNSHGDTMMICPNGHVDGYVWGTAPERIECSHECGADMRPITLDDVRRRLFRMTDDTPNLSRLLDGVEWNQFPITEQQS